MSYFRIYEDNGMNIDAKETNVNIILNTNYVKPVLFSCTYCDAYFYSKEELFAHIKEKHKLDAILMIDNKVKTNANTIYLSDIKSAMIYTYSDDVNIRLDNEKVYVMDYKIDLTKILNDRLYKSGKCTIEIGKNIIHLYKYSVNLLNDNVVNEIINDWSKKCELGKEIVRNYPKTLNESEIRFLDGCYNYFLACNANEYDKKKRYEDAQKILSEFYNLNSIGTTILKIISFRWNWFLKLEKVCYNSNIFDDFDIILSIVNNKRFPSKINEQKQVGQLYIEDELKKNIEAFINYYNKDYDLVNEYFRSFENIEIRDINFNDRLLFLRGLMDAEKGKIRRARSISRDITSEIIQQKLKDILVKYDD